MGKEIHYGATAVIQARDDKKGLKLGMWTPSAVNTKNGIRSTALHVTFKGGSWKVCHQENIKIPKKHFKLYTILTDYLKTILIHKNQQSLHSRRGLEIHILPAPPLEDQLRDTNHKLVS